MRDNGRRRRRAGAAAGVATALVTLVNLSGCAAEDDAAITIEQKMSADAQAPTTAPPGERERILPMLRKYHDQLTWPQGRDVSPDKMWEAIAPSVAQVIFDDTAAQGEVGFINLCAWAVTAIDTVKASKDTDEVRTGLLQSSKLMPGAESMSQEMADEVALGNLEKTQQFVTANKCHEDFD